MSIIKRKDFTISEFKELYLTKNLTITQVGEALGMSYWTVCDYIRKNKIVKKPRKSREQIMQDNESEYYRICYNNKSDEILIERHNNLKLTKNKIGVYFLHEMIDGKWGAAIKLDSYKPYNTLEELKKSLTK